MSAVRGEVSCRALEFLVCGSLYRVFRQQDRLWYWERLATGERGAGKLSRAAAVKAAELHGRVTARGKREVVRVEMLKVHAYAWMNEAASSGNYRNLRAYERQVSAENVQATVWVVVADKDGAP